MGQENNKLFKLLWLIPIVLLGYIAWVNLLPLGGTITYLIDVGAEDTDGRAMIIGPFDRISDKKIVNVTSFRELEEGLVYFVLDSRWLKDTNEVAVRVRFNDNFPEEGKFIVGARDDEEWSYYWKDVYVPFYEQLARLPVVVEDGNIKIYTTDGTSTANINSIGEFEQTLPPGSVIALSNTNLSINQRVIVNAATGSNDNQNGPLIISTALRGGHTFWTYVKNDSLELKVTKQDLNWYQGADELEIEVYSLDGELVGSTTIPDDENETENGHLGAPESQSLKVVDLQTGAHRIEFIGSGDLMITEIEINQGKFVVADKVYLVGTNDCYFKDSLPSSPVSLYGTVFEESELRFHTWHYNGLQQISIVGNSFQQYVNVSQVDMWFNANLEPGSYQLTIPEQDITIEFDGYLSFTSDSFFLPKWYEVLDLKYDFTWATENADYLIINYSDYSPPLEDNGWMVAQASWDREEFLIRNNKLDFCLNTPHLSQRKEYTIPVDQIEIKLTIPPIWERFG